ncbi:MAG TPA: ABC transporter substrate-binding protein [Caulobacteraceae bacterium]
MRPGRNAIIALAAASIASIARAAATDPAAARIESFDRALVEMMKQGPELGAKGRLHRLQPVVEETFDLPLMTKFAVGPTWSTMSEADHQALIRAFGRLTTASYAHNFDRYDGERFDVSPLVQTRGPDKIVSCRLTPQGRAPVQLTYRMRLADGSWKIVDVYYGAVSQLTTRRSDFAGPLGSGGPKGLIAHLDGTSAELMK